ncbi:MAG: hypothetical protein ACRC20_09620 [Segniliparus sp.]|uniref:hypothetical protein n=1 Tax=Segniliparus sp. TaxID=2804064 RepID=UPI003F369610
MANCEILGWEFLRRNPKAVDLRTCPADDPVATSELMALGGRRLTSIFRIMRGDLGRPCIPVWEFYDFAVDEQINSIDEDEDPVCAQLSVLGLLYMLAKVEVHFPDGQVVERTLDEATERAGGGATSFDFCEAMLTLSKTGTLSFNDTDPGFWEHICSPPKSKKSASFQLFMAGFGPD